MLVRRVVTAGRVISAAVCVRPVAVLMVRRVVLVLAETLAVFRLRLSRVRRRFVGRSELAVVINLNFDGWATWVMRV